jgi:hypothetical protein
MLYKYTQKGPCFRPFVTQCPPSVEHPAIGNFPVVQAAQIKSYLYCRESDQYW